MSEDFDPTSLTKPDGKVFRLLHLKTGKFIKFGDSKWLTLSEAQNLKTTLSYVVGVELGEAKMPGQRFEERFAIKFGSQS